MPRLTPCSGARISRRCSTMTTPRPSVGGTRRDRRRPMKKLAIAALLLISAISATTASAQGGHTTWRQFNRSRYVYQNEVRLYQSGNPNGSAARVNRAYNAYLYDLHAKIGPGR